MQALLQAIDSGEVKIETLGENVVINFPKEQMNQDEIKSMIQDTMAALAAAVRGWCSLRAKFSWGLEANCRLAASWKKLPEDGNQGADLHKK